MAESFLLEKVIAKMPEISSGDVVIDLLLGEDNNCACRLLEEQELSRCRMLGPFFFHDEGLGEFNNSPCQIVRLSERGRFFAQDLYRDKYWPKFFVLLFHFWEDFRDQPLFIQLTPLIWLFFIIILIIIK